MKHKTRKVKSVKHKKVVHSWDRVANLRKTQKKKYCKKYYKGKYKIDKRGCKKDPRCLYADMGSGGEWCYTIRSHKSAKTKSSGKSSSKTKKMAKRTRKKMRKSVKKRA